MSETNVVSAPTNPVESLSIKPQSISITDKRELYKCYMPFIKGGGLFIPFNEDLTPNKITPGKKIFIVFSLMDSKVKTTIHGKVIWISKNGFTKGFGITLGDSPAMKAFKDNIETIIADIAVKKEPTYTL